MVDQHVNVTGFEIIQDRNGNCSVCIDSKKCHAPSQGVLAAQGNLVTTLYACVLKSANDASLVLGMYMAGTERDFCDLMNSRAADIGHRPRL